jgi:hypothetical protein
MLRNQYTMIAEHVREGLNGKYDLLGAFDTIYTKQVPSAHASLFFVAQVVTDTEDGLGKKKFTLTCYRPNGQPMFEQSGELVLKAAQGAWLGSARVNIGFQGFPVPDYGRYRFVFRIDGKEISSHPLLVATPPKA